jgi:hypothetical protein
MDGPRLAGTWDVGNGTLRGWTSTELWQTLDLPLVHPLRFYSGRAQDISVDTVKGPIRYINSQDFRVKNQFGASTFQGLSSRPATVLVGANHSPPGQPHWLLAQP